MILTTRLPGSTSRFPGPIMRPSRSSGPCAPTMDLIPGITDRMIRQGETTHLPF